MISRASFLKSSRFCTKNFFNCNHIKEMFARKISPSPSKLQPPKIRIVFHFVPTPTLYTCYFFFIGAKLLSFNTAHRHFHRWLALVSATLSPTFHLVAMPKFMLLYPRTGYLYSFCSFTVILVISMAGHLEKFPAISLVLTTKLEKYIPQPLRFALIQEH